MLFAPVWFSPDAKKRPHQKPGGGCNSCVWNVVRWRLDDNDYHHNFNNTLKAHLLSTGNFNKFEKVKFIMCFIAKNNPIGQGKFVI